MSALSTLGMTPDRRRIFQAGIDAVTAREAEAAQREIAPVSSIGRQGDLARQAGRHPVIVIAAEVADANDLALSDIIGPRRFGRLVRARQEAMWRARRETNSSLPAIGRRFGGRDHTTVLHSIRRHQARIEAQSVTTEDRP